MECEKRLVRYSFFTFLLALSIIAHTAQASGPSDATQPCAINYWVSTSGDDSAKGSASAPFVTINRAQLAVRHNKLRGLCTIYVNIRAGVYTLSAPLTFDPLDSGSVGARVIYQAAPENTSPVTISGGRYVTLRRNVSLNDPVGTVDFGPCFTGSSITPLCLGTGTIPYGADMGGCLPFGDLTYIENYFADTLNFFGPQICQNDYIPPYPVDLTFVDNIPTTSVADVPNWILLQAGAH